MGDFNVCWFLEIEDKVKEWIDCFIIFFEVRYDLEVCNCIKDYVIDGYCDMECMFGCIMVFFFIFEYYLSLYGFFCEFCYLFVVEIEL